MCLSISLGMFINTECIYFMYLNINNTHSFVYNLRTYNLYNAYFIVLKALTNCAHM